MGQFSWMTDDTDKQIGSMRENTITVYMHDNKGNVWKEDEYDGYGVFGGKDYYDLVAEMNGYNKDNYMKYYKKGEKPMYDELRIVGIDIEGEYDNGERKYKFPRLVQREMSEGELDHYKFDTPPERDPNQGWYQPEPEECEDCSGSGEIESQCDVCFGTGTYEVEEEDEDGFTTSEECYECDGSGEVFESCYSCDGAGEITPGRYAKGGKTDEKICLYKHDLEDDLGTYDDIEDIENDLCYTYKPYNVKDVDKESTYDWRKLRNIIDGNWLRYGVSNANHLIKRGNFFQSDNDEFEDEGMWTYYHKTDGNLYLIRTEGFDYPRYVVRITNVPKYLQFTKGYAKGGTTDDREYVLNYSVYVHKDSYEEGSGDEVHSWDSSTMGDSDKLFTSKPDLMKFIKEVIERDTYEDKVEYEDFDIHPNEDGETTLDYYVLCKYIDLDRGYDHYEVADKKSIELWKKGKKELFSVMFIFRVNTYESRKEAKFAKGGKTKTRYFLMKEDNEIFYTEATDMDDAKDVASMWNADIIKEITDKKQIAKIKKGTYNPHLDLAGYAKGGSVRRANNSELIRYASFTDDSFINLVRLTSGFGRYGDTKYKNPYKYGISYYQYKDGKIDPESQTIQEFKTLEDAENEFIQLVMRRDANVSLLVKDEKTGNYAKGGRVSTERLEQKLKRAYPNINLRADENSISIFEEFPTDRKGDSIADYYSESSDRTFGIKNHFNNFLERNGYWAEWQNPEHIEIWQHYEDDFTDPAGGSGLHSHI